MVLSFLRIPRLTWPASIRRQCSWSWRQVMTSRGNEVDGKCRYCRAIDSRKRQHYAFGVALLLGGFVQFEVWMQPPKPYLLLWIWCLMMWRLPYEGNHFVPTGNPRRVLKCNGTHSVASWRNTASFWFQYCATLWTKEKNCSPTVDDYVITGQGAASLCHLRDVAHQGTYYHLKDPSLSLWQAIPTTPARPVSPSSKYCTIFRPHFHTSHCIPEPLS